MNKKLRKLQKALKALGIESQWDMFSDNSDEWLDINIVKGDLKVTIVFHTNNEITVWTEKKKWDDDSSNQII